MKIILSSIILIAISPYCKMEIKKEHSSKIDYCKKIDTLVNERYYWKTKHLKNSERILDEIEKKTGIVGTYNLGFAGMTYCDTFFNNDIRRWRKYFNCIDKYLPPAAKTITAPCDTTKFKMDN